MSRVVKVILLGVGALLFTLCLIFMLANINALNKSTPTHPGGEAAEELARENRERTEKLRQAPWQGLRYLHEEQTRRFHSPAGETQQVDLIQPMALVKIYFLSPDGELTFPWEATEILFRSKPVYLLAKKPIQEGQLGVVQLQGEYVVPSGVDWKDWDLEYCRIAQIIDNLLVLDERGAGISNGFIRYSWAAPTYSLYSFLQWQLVPVESQGRDLVSENWG